MDAQRWERLSRLFDAALDLPEAQQEAYIVENCTGDAQLAAALRRMLAADAEAASGDFLETPMAAVLPEQWRDETLRPADYAPGSRQFGPYRLLRLIGQGGMGEVHLAERADGAFEQRVALKLLPHPTPGLMQRFRQERQILAQLEHPHIARLLDGGVGEHNVPYFAMEFVDGEPITRHVRQHTLDIRQVLALFLKICAAVRYAHSNLVVHRDLKPSNILVTSDGTPKLLDFGIAKVLQISGDGEARTLTRVFTVDYAAPEQIRGETITTATDVYALGVILYELLAGSRPYALREREITLEQAIASVQPDPPSVALARMPATTLQQRRQLRGDLDRVVMTALAKEPEQRYSSAEALAADIRAYLDGRPIAARGDSLWYRMRKFARRNRAAVAAAASVLLILFAAAAISLQQARIARAQATRADAVNRFLETIFRSIDPANAKGREIAAVELIDAGAARVDRDLADQPAAAAQLHSTLGETYFALGDYAKAEAQYRAALALFQPDQSATAISVQAKFAELRLRSGATTEAQQLLDAAQARAASEAPQNAELSDSLLALRAEFAAQRGDNAAALQLGEQRWQALVARIGEDGPAAVNAEQAYAAYLSGASRHQEAVKHQAHVVALRRGTSDDTPELASALDSLGHFQSYLTEPDATLASFEESLRIRRKILPRNHPDIARSINATAEQLTDVGKAAQAMALEPEALAILHAQKQTDTLLMAEVLNNWGVACHYAGDDDCAVARISEALELWRAMYGPAHTYVLTARSSLAALLTGKGELKAAEDQLRDVAATREADISTHGDSEDKADALHHTRELLATNLYFQQRMPEALNVARANFASVEKRFPPPKIDHMEAQSLLARIEAYAGDTADAQQRAKAALDEGDELKLGDTEPRAWANFAFGYAALNSGRADEAEAAARVAVATFTRTFGAEHPKTAEAHGLLGRILAQRRQNDAAKKELDAAIAGLSAKQPWQPVLTTLRNVRASL